jgi:hypothetical protein
MEVKLVQAFNGKWHIWEADTGVEPAVAQGYYTYPLVCPDIARYAKQGRGPALEHSERCHICPMLGKTIKCSPHAQPERPRAITNCGEHVMVKKVFVTPPDWKLRGNLCDRCRTVLPYRLAKEDQCSTSSQ